MDACVGRKGWSDSAFEQPSCLRKANCIGWLKPEQSHGLNDITIETKEYFIQSGIFGKREQAADSARKPRDRGVFSKGAWRGMSQTT